MENFMRRMMLITALLLTVTGCAGIQPEQRSPAPIDMPGQYTLYTHGEKGPDRWWQAFGSPELNHLVDEALTRNFSIQSAWARLRQASALARQAGASLMPAFDYSAGAETARRQIKMSSGGSTDTTGYETWDMGLAASYEVDLWGRLQSRRQAEVVTAQAAKEDLDAAAVSVAGEVVDTWIDIMAVRQKIVILQQQIKANTTLLDLQWLRFANGKAGALDVSQQRQALASVKADLPLLQLYERQRVNQMVLLLGRASAGGLALTQNTMPELIPIPIVGLPVDLLASRPDIRAAGLRLQSADWNVSAVRADRLPAIALSARAVFSSGSLDLLFSNWVASLAAGITGPVFDAGRRAAEVDRVRAVAQERLNDYAGIVAMAVKEVENSLVGELRQREYLDLLEDQLNASRLTLKDAGLQYRNGQSDYLSYISALTSIQNLERQMVEEQANLIKYRVLLYRTLGGDWTGHLFGDEAPEP
jgi:NodT family efflux transporter outer membrane factor (OMF) lipoprotein